jgi:hypothetical protein
LGRRQLDLWSNPRDPPPDRPRAIAPAPARSAWLRSARHDAAGQKPSALDLGLIHVIAPGHCNSLLSAPVCTHGMTPTTAIDSFEFHNDAGPAGYQTFSVDWSSGMIRGRGEGFWSMQQTTAHFRRWVDCVRTIQSAGLRVRVMADLRKSQTQSREVADFLRQALEGIYRPEDRIAMIVSNSLVKMQMRRLLASDIREYFLSPGEAEAWLATFPSQFVPLDGQAA